MTPSEWLRFRELVATKLAGREVDLVGFADAVLELVLQSGEVACRLWREDCLHVTIGAESCDVEVPAARAKLRMLCARLSVLCTEAQQQPDFPYGGTGTIPAAGASADGWQLDFINTLGEHEFRITVRRPQHCAAPTDTTRAEPGL